MAEVTQAAEHVRGHPADSGQGVGAQVAEEWRPIPGTDGRYEASSFGEIRSLWYCHGWRPAPQLLSGYLAKDGYRYYQISEFEGRKRTMKGHVLIALAFLGPRPGRWVDVAHWDGNKANNRLSNLRYACRRDNQCDAKRHGTAGVGVRHPRAKLDPDKVKEIRRLKAETDITYRALAQRFGVQHPAIIRIVKGDHWKPASMAILPRSL